MVAGVITKSRAKMRPPQVGHFAQKHIRQCVLISQLELVLLVLVKSEKPRALKQGGHYCRAA